MKKENPRLCVEIYEGSSSTCRDATPEEIQAASIIRNKLDEINKKIEELENLKEEIVCKHEVIFDEDIGDYDSRACWGCGAFMGFI